MVWIAVTLAVLIGLGTLAWLWTIPAPARLAVVPLMATIPPGARISLDGRSFGLVLTAENLEIVVQPHHPLYRRLMRWR